MKNGALDDDQLRVNCTLYTPSGIDETTGELIDGWWPEGCHRAGELTERYLPDGWDVRGHYALCPSCLSRWNRLFDKRAELNAIMEGAA